MPRPLRIWFPGAWYHITARGNNREAIFHTNADFQCYLELLRLAVSDFECRLHAYVLMSNHIHLMLETGEVSISRVMHEMHSRYAAYMNRRHRHSGHVFQGRYYSRLVEQDAYALALSRYIHLNPVRAHLVDDPSAYPWSSYHAYVHRSDVLVTTDIVLALTRIGSSDPRHAYQGFVLGELLAPVAAEPKRWASLAYLRQAKKGVRPLLA